MQSPPSSGYQAASLFLTASRNNTCAAVYSSAASFQGSKTIQGSGAEQGSLPGEEGPGLRPGGGNKPHHNDVSSQSPDLPCNASRRWQKGGNSFFFALCLDYFENLHHLVCFLQVSRKPQNNISITSRTSFVLGTAAPALAPGPARRAAPGPAAGAAPGPAAAVAAVAMGRSPATPAESLTGCANCLQKLFPLCKQYGNHKSLSRAGSNTLGHLVQHSGLWRGKTRALSQRDLALGVRQGGTSHHPKTPLHLPLHANHSAMQTMVPCIPRDGVGHGEEGTALPCCVGRGCRNQPQQLPAPSPARPGSNRLQLGLVTAAGNHHQICIVYKHI